MDQVIEKDGLYVYEASHRIYYNTKKPVPISEVIVALQGLQGLLKPVPKLVSAMTGVEIVRGEYHIARIESGSLIEDVIVRFFFKDKDSLDKFVDKLSNTKGMKTVVITVAITGAVAYGLHLAAGKSPTPSITATNNTIIKIGAAEMNLTAGDISAIIKSTLDKDKKLAAESALKFVAPTRGEPGSSVTVANQDVPDAQKVEIPASAISEAPARIELQANERLEEYQRTTLTIRATNLDSKTSGWAGRLSNRDERLPIELDPSVAEAALFGKELVIVDAAVIYREKGKSRELKASRIYVRKVY